MYRVIETSMCSFSPLNLGLVWGILKNVTYKVKKCHTSDIYLGVWIIFLTSGDTFGKL